MQRTLLIAALFIFTSALTAQNTPTITYGSITTPQIQLGSDTTPTIITVPPVVEVSGAPSEAEPRVSNAPPASTALLATRHFDFIVSPIAPFTRGSMEDSSISLGEYARQLRAQKRAVATTANPNAMAQPATPR
jgi:hypothetical protein